MVVIVTNAAFIYFSHYWRFFCPFMSQMVCKLLSLLTDVDIFSMFWIGFWRILWECHCPFQLISVIQISRPSSGCSNWPASLRSSLVFRGNFIMQLSTINDSYMSRFFPIFDTTTCDVSHQCHIGQALCLSQVSISVQVWLKAVTTWPLTSLLCCSTSWWW